MFLLKNIENLAVRKRRPINRQFVIKIKNGFSVIFEKIIAIYTSNNQLHCTEGRQHVG